MDTGLVLEWGGAERRFHLRIGELRALQERTRSGPPEVFNRLRSQTWRVDDVRETIRLGLIGGGTSEVEANQLVKDFVDCAPLNDSVAAAMGTIMAALLGSPDESPAPGKPEAGESLSE